MAQTFRKPRPPACAGAVVADYVPRALQVPARAGVVGLSTVMLLGLLKLTVKGEGITGGWGQRSACLWEAAPAASGFAACTPPALGFCCLHSCFADSETLPPPSAVAGSIKRLWSKPAAQ